MRRTRDEILNGLSALTRSFDSVFELEIELGGGVEGVRAALVYPLLDLPVYNALAFLYKKLKLFALLMREYGERDSFIFTVTALGLCFDLLIGVRL